MKNQNKIENMRIEYEGKLAQFKFFPKISEAEIISLIRKRYEIEFSFDGKKYKQYRETLEGAKDIARSRRQNGFTNVRIIDSKTNKLKRF